MAKPTNDGGDTPSTPSSASYSDKIRDAVQNSADAPAKANEVENPPKDDPNAAAGDDEEDKKTPPEADDVSDGDDDAGNGDGDGEDDSAADDAAGDDPKGKQASEFRFSQFKGDGTPDAYQKNLENAYLESSSEGIKQRDRADSFERQVNAIKDAASRDPEFGEKLLSILKDGGGSDGAATGKDGLPDGGAVTQTSNNPFLVDAETNWNTKSEQSAKEFAEANPEVITDPKINADVKRWMRVYSNDIYENEKRLITAGEAMEMAYKHLGLADKRKSNQDLVDGMKQNAAPTRPQAAKKKPTSSGAGNTKQFSDLTLTLAEKMGVSKERLLKGSK